MQTEFYTYILQLVKKDISFWHFEKESITSEVMQTIKMAVINKLNKSSGFNANVKVGFGFLYVQCYLVT